MAAEDVVTWNSGKEVVWAAWRVQELIAGGGVVEGMGELGVLWVGV